MRVKINYNAYADAKRRGNVENNSLKTIELVYVHRNECASQFLFKKNACCVFRLVLIFALYKCA